MFVAEQKLQEAKSAISSRTLWPDFDAKTYISMDHYIDFQEHKDLKRIWISKAAKRWRVDANELYQRATDVCPAFKTPLDYGLGYNMVLREAQGRDNDWFRPHVDHIIPKSVRPDLQYDVNNMIVISARANKIKNNVVNIDELLAVHGCYKELEENYGA